MVIPWLVLQIRSRVQRPWRCESGSETTRTGAQGHPFSWSAPLAPLCCQQRLK